VDRCVAPVDRNGIKSRPELRLRVGNYRISFREDTEKQVYVITAIVSRGDSELMVGWARQTLRRVEF
jgi:mRNA-degrading endonuclease RelE of RelBE toxin-antitoxin system